MKIIILSSLELTRSHYEFVQLSAAVFHKHSLDNKAIKVILSVDDKIVILSSLRLIRSDYDSVPLSTAVFHEQSSDDKAPRVILSVDNKNCHSLTISVHSKTL